MKFIRKTKFGIPSALIALCLMGVYFFFPPAIKTEAGCNASDNTRFEFSITEVTAGDEDYVCIGSDVTWSCTVSNNQSDLECEWSGDAEGEGWSTTSTHDTVGEKSATANVSGTPWEDEVCEGSETATITVIEVSSLDPDGGEEYDDEDGDDDTKAYILPVASSGQVTVTATPNPGCSEEDLPSCWSLSGGEGDSLLERTVSKTEGSSATITCTAGTSSKAAKINVLGVESINIEASTNFDLDGMVDYDSDDEDDTLDYAVAFSKTTGASVTATAVPSADIPEEKLPSFWSYSGGEAASGDGKYERKTGIGLADSGCTFDASSGVTRKVANLHVVRVSGLSLNNAIDVTPEGAMEDYDGDGANDECTYVMAAQKEGEDLVVVDAEASSSDSDVPEDKLPGWSFSGGEAVGIGKLHRKVDNSSPGTVNFEVSCGDSKKKADLHIIEVKDITFDPAFVAAVAGETTSASATVTPVGRTLKWSITSDSADNYGCSIDEDSGVITAGSESCVLTVRAEDSECSDAYAEANLCIGCSEITTSRTFGPMTFTFSTDNPVTATGGTDDGWCIYETDLGSLDSVSVLGFHSESFADLTGYTLKWEEQIVEEGTPPYRNVTVTWEGNVETSISPLTAQFTNIDVQISSEGNITGNLTFTLAVTEDVNVTDMVVLKNGVSGEIKYEFNGGTSFDGTWDFSSVSNLNLDFKKNDAVLASLTGATISSEGVLSGTLTNGTSTPSYTTNGFTVDVQEFSYGFEYDMSSETAPADRLTVNSTSGKFELACTTGDAISGTLELAISWDSAVDSFKAAVTAKDDVKLFNKLTVSEMTVEADIDAALDFQQLSGTAKLSCDEFSAELTVSSFIYKNTGLETLSLSNFNATFKKFTTEFSSASYVSTTEKELQFTGAKLTFGPLGEAAVDSFKLKNSGDFELGTTTLTMNIPNQKGSQSADMESVSVVITEAGANEFKAHFEYTSEVDLGDLYGINVKLTEVNLDVIAGSSGTRLATGSYVIIQPSLSENKDFPLEGTDIKFTLNSGMSGEIQVNFNNTTSLASLNSTIDWDFNGVNAINIDFFKGTTKVAKVTDGSFDENGILSAPVSLEGTPQWDTKVGEIKFTSLNVPLKFDFVNETIDFDKTGSGANGAAEVTVDEISGASGKLNLGFAFASNITATLGTGSALKFLGMDVVVNSDFNAVFGYDFELQSVAGNLTINNSTPEIEVQDIDFELKDDVLTKFEAGASESKYRGFTISFDSMQYVPSVPKVVFNGMKMTIASREAAINKFEITDGGGVDIDTITLKLPINNPSASSGGSVEKDVADISITFNDDNTVTIDYVGEYNMGSFMGFDTNLQDLYLTVTPDKKVSGEVIVGMSVQSGSEPTVGPVKIKSADITATLTFNNSSNWTDGLALTFAGENMTADVLKGSSTVVASLQGVSLSSNILQGTFKVNESLSPLDLGVGSVKIKDFNVPFKYDFNTNEFDLKKDGSAIFGMGLTCTGITGEMGMKATLNSSSMKVDFDATESTAKMFGMTLSDVTASTTMTYGFEMENFSGTLSAQHDDFDSAINDISFEFSAGDLQKFEVGTAVLKWKGYSVTLKDTVYAKADAALKIGNGKLTLPGNGDAEIVNFKITTSGAISCEKISGNVNKSPVEVTFNATYNASGPRFKGEFSGKFKTGSISASFSGSIDVGKEDDFVFAYFKAAADTSMGVPLGPSGLKLTGLAAKFGFNYTMPSSGISNPFNLDGLGDPSKGNHLIGFGIGLSDAGNMMGLQGYGQVSIGTSGTTVSIGGTINIPKTNPNFSSELTVNYALGTTKVDGNLSTTIKIPSTSAKIVDVSNASLHYSVDGSDFDITTNGSITGKFFNKIDLTSGNISMDGDLGNASAMSGSLSAHLGYVFQDSYAYPSGFLPVNCDQPEPNADSTDDNGDGEGLGVGFGFKGNLNVTLDANINAQLSNSGVDGSFSVLVSFIADADVKWPCFVVCSAECVDSITLEGAATLTATKVTDGLRLQGNVVFYDTQDDDDSEDADIDVVIPFS